MSFNRTNEFATGIKHIDIVVISVIGSVLFTTFLIFLALVLCSMWIRLKHRDTDDDTIHFVEVILDGTRSSWFDQHSDDGISGDRYTSSTSTPSTGNDAEHMIEEQSPNSELSTNPIEPRGLEAENDTDLEDADLEESCVFSRTSKS